MPKSIQATAEGMPQAAHSEPVTLSEALRLYRRGLAEYDFRSFDTPESEYSELVDRTYGPHLKVLTAWEKPAATAEEAAQALWLAMRDEGGVYGCPAADTMLKAAYGYLKGVAR